MATRRAPDAVELENNGRIWINKGKWQYKCQKPILRRAIYGKRCLPLLVVNDHLY